jgi:large subunit ribosomal protein L24e
LKIFPGHGIRYVPCVTVQTTRPVFTFISKKARELFHKRRNPRVISWTQLYRKQHKKGTVEQHKRTKRRKVAKVERAIAGASIEFLNAQRNQSVEQRKKQADAAKLAEKEKQKNASAKKAEKKQKAEQIKKQAQSLQQKTTQVPKQQARAPQTKSKAQGKR